MKLEEALPALREGKQIRRQGSKEDLYVQLNLLASDWEIVPSPKRVADYLTPIQYSENIYAKQTHPIGSQPEGSVMVPGSERDL